MAMTLKLYIILLILRVVNGNDVLIMMQTYLQNIPEQVPLMMLNAFLVCYAIWWENTLRWKKWSSVGGIKACVEFAKRLDPIPKFYYHTSSHCCFYEGPMPDFSQFQWPKQNSRHQRVRRWEQPLSLMTGRASLVTPSACSIRMTYHNVPLELPPPPGSVQQHLSEHSYVCITVSWTVYIICLHK